MHFSTVDQYYKSCKNCIRYCKSHLWTCNEVKGLYDTIITIIIPTYSYTRKNITRLLRLALLRVLHTCNNTDGNKTCDIMVLWWHYLLLIISLWFTVTHWLQDKIWRETWDYRWHHCVTSLVSFPGYHTSHVHESSTYIRIAKLMKLNTRLKISSQDKMEGRLFVAVFAV